MLESYHFSIIFFLVIICYILTWQLKVKGKITLVDHRRFWNFVLLLSFLVSGILGLIMAFAIDFEMPLKWYAFVLWFHVEAGIIMATVSVFHVLWHLRYYIPKKNRKSRV